MGLSASQVRYLSLTARQSNVEYQGQQVNQARTELANQSSQLYQQMMTLKAPTAPSIYDYVINPPTKPQLDFSEEGSFQLSASEQKNFEVYYSSTQPSFYDFDIPTYSYDETTSTYTQYNSDGTKTTGITELPTDSTYALKTTGYQGADKKDYYEVHVPEDAGYEYNMQTGGFELTSASYFPKNISAYNAAQASYNTNSDPTRKAIYSSDKEEEQIEANIVGYTTTATNTPNEAQYKAAMTAYEREEQQYQEALAAINAKTEEIHESDKQLESQLKQLDTEQEALQTELEAVKKVIEKNVEQTFKTFA